MSLPRPRRFAVIGAGGAAGLATIRVVSQELRARIELGECELVGFEQREELGGIWYVIHQFTPDLTVVFDAYTYRFSDPNPTSSSGQEWPESAIYESLTTNIPHPLMFYPSHLAAPSTPIFATAQVVQDYMQEYVNQFNLRRYIKFNCSVTAATWEESTKLWRITCRNINDPGSESEVSYFDHIFIANGHYRHPFVPNITGLEHWASSNSRSYMHSVWYRNPEPYRDFNVLIVGGGRSGIDISDEVSSIAKRTVHSIRSRGDVDFEHLSQRGTISHFTSDGFVHFVNGKSEYVDRVIFATGYECDCSFLTQLPTDEPRLSSDHLYNSGFHIYPLALHIFPLQAAFPPSSLAFIGIPIGILVFTQVEAEATLAIRQMTGKVLLNFDEEILEVTRRNEQLRKSHKDSALEVARAWHRFGADPGWDFVDYIWAKAGESHRVPAWKRDLLPLGYIMRAEWARIEKAGLGKAWVDGVGESGIEDWANHMRLVLKRAQERQFRAMTHLS